MNPMKKSLVAIALVSTLTLSGCGYNTLQVKDEAVTASWSEVQNQYQRRADLVPNLVNVVKGYAKHEEQVLTEVTQARANVAGLKVDKEVLEDPALFEKYQQAQAQMTNSVIYRCNWKVLKIVLPWHVIVILRLFRILIPIRVSSRK